MPLDTTAIRISIRREEALREDKNVSPRDAFWSPLRQMDQFEGASVSTLEARLKKEFIESICDDLVRQVRDELRSVEQAALGPEYDELRMMMREALHYWMRREPTWPYPDPFAQYFEARRRLFEDAPEYKNAIARLHAAARVRFVARIRRYSSLELDLLPAPLDQLAKAFDANFDLFRAFIDATVPIGFGNTYTDEFAHSMIYDISYSDALQNAFTQASEQAVIAAPASSASASAQATGTPSSGVASKAMQRTIWFNNLVHGSFVVPVLLALGVIYFGWKELSSFQQAQFEALKPLFEHQIELLKEDRNRIQLYMNSGLTQSQTPSDANTTNAAKTNP